MRRSRSRSLHSVAILTVAVTAVLAAGGCAKSTDTGTNAGPETGGNPTGPANATVGDKLVEKNGVSVQVFSYGAGTPGPLGGPSPGMKLTAVDAQGCVPAGGPAASFNPLYFSLKLSDNTKVDADLAGVEGAVGDHRLLQPTRRRHTVA